jgi:hypothetical protein
MHYYIQRSGTKEWSRISEGHIVQRYGWGLLMELDSETMIDLENGDVIYSVDDRADQ